MQRQQNFSHVSQSMYSEITIALSTYFPTEKDKILLQYPFHYTNKSVQHV